MRVEKHNFLNVLKCDKIEDYCSRTILLSPVSPVMRSCVGIIRRSFYWPTATCSESHCRKTMCNPAWMLFGGKAIYSVDEMSSWNYTKLKFTANDFSTFFFFQLRFQLWQRHADPDQQSCVLQWWPAWGLHGDERSPVLALCHTAVKAGSRRPTDVEGCHRAGCTLLPAGLPGNESQATHHQAFELPLGYSLFSRNIISMFIIFMFSFTPLKAISLNV